MDDRQYRHLSCASLSSRIPFYRLPKVLRDYPELRSVSKLSLVESFRSVGLSRWEEGANRMISFAELNRQFRRAFEALEHGVDDGAHSASGASV